MLVFTLIRRHYRWFEERIKPDERELGSGVPAAVPVEPGGPRNHVLVPVDGINKISLGAVGMARALSSLVTAVHLTDDRAQAEEFRERWNEAVPDVPLLLIESPYRAFVAPMIAFVESLERSEPGRRISIVLPSFAARHWWERLLHSHDASRLKRSAKALKTVRVVEFPYYPGSESA
jgi:hypothetical protein